MPNGTKYEGFFVEDKFEGLGSLTTLQSKYEGNFKNGFLNGHGRLIKSDGSIYEGNFFDNIKNGFGEEIWTNGSHYLG